MRECWMNVYRDKTSGRIWRGAPHASADEAADVAVYIASPRSAVPSNCLYRIHVRLK